MPSPFKLSCVLFDLDGTLVDTSADLIAALNTALQQYQFASVAAEGVKPYISYGAVAMIKHSVAASVSDELQAEILKAFLHYYQHNIATHSVLFPGMVETLNAIEALGLKWGVITNKRQRFTDPLMAALNLTHRAACIISGDTTPYSKPHPQPMLAGCLKAGVTAKDCVFIGDASHDIAAGRAADMKTLVATYGFLKPDDQPEHWGADHLVASPSHINDWIKAAICH
ncbi:MAG: HAD-IA family hydrolase [Methylococcaceae bacterium]|nr:HAD-IA family hydrolase [Methylococcaceae bacterium]